MKFITHYIFPVLTNLIKIGNNFNTCFLSKCIRVLLTVLIFVKSISNLEFKLILVQPFHGNKAFKSIASQPIYILGFTEDDCCIEQSVS